MNEKKPNEIGLYIKIDKDLKRDFNIKCLEKGSNMSEVIKDYMKEFINN